jgi:hypothetical protein
MRANDDDLVQFDNVRVISSSSPALLCGIGDKLVWLPRRHISGNLFRKGDRGKLLIRRWVARDRHLIDPHEAAASLERAFSPRSSRQLHLVRPGDEGRNLADQG